MTWSDELYIRIPEPDLVVRDGVTIAEKQVGRRELLKVAVRLIVAALRPDRRTYRF